MGYFYVGILFGKFTGFAPQGCVTGLKGRQQQAKPAEEGKKLSSRVFVHEVVRFSGNQLPEAVAKHNQQAYHDQHQVLHRYKHQGHQVQPVEQVHEHKHSANGHHQA